MAEKQAILILEKKYHPKTKRNTSAVDERINVTILNKNLIKTLKTKAT